MKSLPEWHHYKFLDLYYADYSPFWINRSWASSVSGEQRGQSAEIDAALTIIQEDYGIYPYQILVGVDMAKDVEKATGRKLDYLYIMPISHIGVPIGVSDIVSCDSVLFVFHPQPWQTPSLGKFQKCINQLMDNLEGQSEVNI